MQTKGWNVIWMLPLMAALCFGAPAQTSSKSATPGAQAHLLSSGGATLTCRKAGGSSCTASDVRDLNTGLASGRRMHEPLAAIQDLKLTGTNGAISCTQTSGAACTDDQIAALKAFAAEKGGFTVSKMIDKSSPK